ncbi:MAG: class I SAM-dependent methyltransferase [Pseudomonadota bacterium]
MTQPSNQSTPDRIRPHFSRDEQARKAFSSSLRRHVLGPQAAQLRETYEDKVEPEFRRSHGRVPKDGSEIRRAMRTERDFRFYSTIRTCAQEMTFADVIPAVEREMASLAAEAKALSNDPTGGTLTLDPALEVPDNVTQVDVHLAPGGYASEFQEQDLSAGAIYDNAIQVFAFGQFGRDTNDIGMTMANFVRHRFPDLEPARILDCGCTIGHNTLPWATTFPDAEVHGIDVAPGILRYAHARAQGLGIKTHFHQMNATALQFPDNHFDVVFSSMFLHELPVPDIKAFFAEARRVLRPGGVLWNMELPPNSAMGNYESFYLDWDSYYNNEPFYKPFRDQNYQQLVVDAGFSADSYLQATLPRYTFVGEEAFVESLRQPAVFDSQTGRMDPKGTRWFGFGAVKQQGDR